VSRREITLCVQKCPHCKLSHSYIIEVTLRAKPDAPGTLVRAQVQVACAVDGRSYRTQADVAISARQQFVAAQFARFAAAA
jgi:hypothetical protein